MYSFQISLSFPKVTVFFVSFLCCFKFSFNSFLDAQENIENKLIKAKMG